MVGIYCKTSKNNFIKLLVSITIVLYGFHLLRNIYFMYTAIPFLFPIIALMILSIQGKATCNKKGLFITAIFLVGSLLPIIYSFFWFPSVNYAVPIGRYLYMYPFVLFMSFVLKDIRIYIYALKVLALMVVICGLSIIYQTLTGHAVDWFSDPSIRGGLVRYASLLGSLTAYGGCAVFALPIVMYLYQNKWIKLLFTGIIVIALLLTLQKAAIFNLLILFVLFFICSSRKEKLNLFILLVILLILVIFLHSKYIDLTMGNFFHIGGYQRIDVSVGQSIMQRIWQLPSVLFNRYGVEGLLFGVGLVGGSGLFGLSSYPMSHNGIFDLLFLGGLLNLFLFIWFLLWIFIVIRRYRVNSEKQYLCRKTSIFILILFIFNFPMGGIIYFQPYGGMFFYLLACHYLQNLNDKSSVKDIELKKYVKLIRR